MIAGFVYRERAGRTTTRQRIPAPPCRLGALAMAACAALQAPAVWAQATVGPGAVAPVAVTGTPTVVVGGTTINATGTAAAALVNSSILTVDPGAGPSPGAIFVNAVNGIGLQTSGDAGGASLVVQSGGVSVVVSGTGTGMAAIGGSTINATDVAVTLDGAGAQSGNGVVAQNGGIISLAGASSVTVNRDRAIALGASGAGSALAASGTPTVTSSGVSDVGVYMHRGGRVSLPSGTTLNLNGKASSGLIVDATQGVTGPAALTVSLTGSAGTSANSGTGVAVLRGGQLTLDRLTVTGADVGLGAIAFAGDTSTAGGLQDAQATLTLTNAAINVAAPGNSVVMGLSPTTTAIVDASGNSGTFGASTYAAPAGLVASPASASTAVATSTVTASNSTINVNAPAGYGVYAGARRVSGRNSVILVDSNVVVSGTSANGLGADLNGYVSATRTNVQTTGANALYMISGGDVTGGVNPSIELTDSTIRAVGTTNGLISQNFSQLNTSTFRMTGGSLTSEQGIALAASNGPTVATLEGATVTGGLRLLHAYNASGTGLPTSLNLTATSSSVLTGDASAATAATANLNLQTGSQWTGAALSINNVTTDATSTWNVAGNSSVRESVNNAGLLAFTPPAAGAFSTLTTTNYTGGGGTLRVNTLLAGDGAASDRLVINGGAATGTTGIAVVNAGGAGALTTQNGILVVDTANGGTTAANAFTQSGRAVAGVYEYRLYRGARDGSNDQAWYLRSEQQGPTPPTPPAPNPDVIEPMLRPEVAAYLANQRLAAGFLVHSLHDRLGEPQWAEHQTFDDDNTRRKSGWLRVVGKDIGSNSRDGTFSVDSTAWMLQGGGDVAQWSVFRADDRLHLGGILGYSWGSSTSRAAGNPFHTDSDVQGVNVGIYGTWFQNDATRLGWYTDLWAQYGWYTNHVNGQLLPGVRYDSQVLALSAETGYAFYVREARDWAVEPQAQLIYVRGYQGAFTEPATGTRVDSADGNGIVTRLGVRVHRTWIDGKGRRFQPYLTANWWHDGTGNAMAFNGVSMRDVYPQNRYEFKLGLDVQGGKGWTGWTNLGYQFGSQSYHALVGRLGVKYTW